MALSQFMPYGAPELLADQDQRMARASAVATSLLVLLFVGMMLVIPRLPIAAPTPEIPITIVDVEPPPLVDAPTATPPVQPSAPAQSLSDAIATPVPDALAPDVLTSQPSSSGGTEDGTGEPAPAGTGEAGEGIAPAGDPVWGEYRPVDELPVLVSSPNASYSDIARDAGIEGRVVVRLLVGSDGRVKEAVVDPKHSVPMLDAIALEAARGSVFTPALSNGHPVAVWVARPYEFRLH